VQSQPTPLQSPPPKPVEKQPIKQTRQSNEATAQQTQPKSAAEMQTKATEPAPARGQYRPHAWQAATPQSKPTTASPSAQPRDVEQARPGTAEQGSLDQRKKPLSNTRSNKRQRK
jgi:hypothetical protein